MKLFGCKYICNYSVAQIYLHFFLFLKFLFGMFVLFNNKIKNSKKSLPSNHWKGNFFLSICKCFGKHNRCLLCRIHSCCLFHNCRFRKYTLHMYNLRFRMLCCLLEQLSSLMFFSFCLCFKIYTTNVHRQTSARLILLWE